MTEERPNDIADNENEPEKITLESMPVMNLDATDLLPKNVVHCFPAHKSVIRRRRVIAIALGAVFLAAIIYFLLPESSSLGLAVIAMIGCIACVLVLIQSFLIASYRVALDYDQREIVLRYQFQKIRIPFKDFDTREGQPDRAQTLLSSIPSKTSKLPVRYLILDNVRESACYQTGTQDLASVEDFNQLKSEAENIRDAFRGKTEDTSKPVLEDEELTRIVHSAMADHSKNIDEQGGPNIQ